jgi:hypothetical protein
VTVPTLDIGVLREAGHDADWSGSVPTLFDWDLDAMGLGDGALPFGKTELPVTI